MAKGPKPRPLIERFFEKVDITPSCWLWRGARTPYGYGHVRIDSKTLKVAHRISYELFVGPIPEGLSLDHLCRVPNCINPEHLEPVTHRENVLRGIAPAASYARQTHCKRGHPFDLENTTIMKNGCRRCRACDKWHQKRRVRRVKTSV